MKLNSEIKLQKPHLDPIQTTSTIFLILSFIATFTSMAFMISTYLSLQKQVSITSASQLLNQQIVDQAANLIQENTVQFEIGQDTN